jgi:hypothetical protein
VGQNKLPNWASSEYRNHVRMEAKRRALEEIAARQRAADEKRKQEAEQQQPKILPVPAPIQ